MPMIILHSKFLFPPSIVMVQWYEIPQEEECSPDLTGRGVCYEITGLSAAKLVRNIIGGIGKLRPAGT